jgi:hypothetical protein
MPPPITQAEGATKVAELVERFRDNEAYYRSVDFDETSTREIFIDPFFEALGWDVTDDDNLGPLRDVIFHQRDQRLAAVAGEDDWDRDLTEEEIIARQPRVVIPDYAFRIDGNLKFYLEAKRPHVGIDNRSAAWQIKTYSWNQRLLVGVLTDFQRLCVYDSRTRPDYHRPQEGQLTALNLHYTGYVAAWPQIWAALSRDAVVSGSLEKLVGTTLPRGALRVDNAFVGDLAAWRQQLAQDLLDNNADLSRHHLAEATQRILDRLVFLRVCEDRSIIPQPILRRYARIADSYRGLAREFRRLDAIYNGQLFAEHFSERLEVSDGLFQRIIEGLYPPKSPYRFNIIGLDLLGSVYERFLGMEVSVTNGTASIIEKPEVRHSGGVYYTPQWVVQRIVSEALDPLLEGRKPRALTELRILDPACGSGSFLLGALDHLIAWLEDYYTVHPEEDRERHSADVEGRRRLTIDAKRDLVTRCLFGIDIDPQAVEVAQMSLYLRILEVETSNTIAHQTRLFDGALLPRLSSNIRCGNSLLSSADVPAQLMYDEDRALRINPFDWEDDRAGFGQVLTARGGFDAVIGNPPYTRLQVLREFRPEETVLYEQKYVTAGRGSFDLAALFVEKALSLLRPARRGGYGGHLVFIIMRQFIETDAGEPLRALLCEDRRVNSLTDFVDGLVFENASAYTLLLHTTTKRNDTWRLTRVSPPPSRDRLREALASPALTTQQPADALTSEPWSLALPEEVQLLGRLDAQHRDLGQITRGSIFQGVVTGADDTFRVVDMGPDPAGAEHRLVRPKAAPPRSAPIPMETAFLRPICAGRTELARFSIEPPSEWLIFPYERTNPTAPYVLLSPTGFHRKAPHIHRWLTHQRALLEQRQGAWNDHNWYSYSRRQNLEAFEEPKVLVPYMVEELCAAYDDTRRFFVNVATGGYGLGLDVTQGASWEFLAALLNSELLSWVLRRYSRAWRGGWTAARKANLERLPIAVPGRETQDEVVTLYGECQRATTTLKSARRGSHEREIAARRRATAVRAFDHAVFGLYGITDEELLVIRSVGQPTEVVSGAQETTL